MTQQFDGMVPVSADSVCGGDLMAKFDEAIGTAMKDVKERAHILKPRVVTIKMTVTPPLPDIDDGFFMPEISGEVGVSLPKVQAKGQRALMADDGTFYVNPVEEDPRQGELPNVVEMGR